MKHSEENIEKQKEQGLKQQGIKSAMAWRVSKMKPRSPNGQSASSLFVFTYSCLDELLSCCFLGYSKSVSSGTLSWSCLLYSLSTK